MQTDRRGLLTVFAGLIGVLFLTACGQTTTTVVETIEVTRVVEVIETVEITREIEILRTVEVTREVEVIVVVTATPTPIPPTPTPIPTATPAPSKYNTETITFTTEDDLELEGTLFLSEGDKGIAVVFAHMAGGDNDQQNWVPAAKQIARRGFTGLTFNLRCYGESGCGGKGSGAVLLSRDLSAAIDFLNEQGFDRVVCVGASMGGRGCVTVAFDEALAGLVVVAGTGSGDPERQNLEDFASPDMPKLFIVSENDHIKDRTLAMTELYESAPDPKILKLFPGKAHGTELFNTQYGQELRETLFEFLAEIRSSS